MDEKKGTSKHQTASKAIDTVAQTSPLYELYAYLTLMQGNISSLRVVLQTRLLDISKQTMDDLNALQQAIATLPDDHCFTTIPISLPVSPKQQFFLTPDAACVFGLFKNCLELTCTHLKTAPAEEKNYPNRSKTCDFIVQRNMQVYATTRRLFHCLAHALSKQSHFIDYEASIVNFLPIISDNLIANLSYHPNLLTMQEHSRFISTLTIGSAQEWVETLRLNCPDFNHSICNPLEDAIQLGWRRVIQQLVFAGYQLLGRENLYKNLSMLPGWRLYQQAIKNTSLHEAIFSTFGKHPLTFFPRALTQVVYEYSKEPEENTPQKSTSGCKLM